MLKSIGVNLINAFWSIETVDINHFNNAIIEKVNFNYSQLYGKRGGQFWKKKVWESGRLEGVRDSKSENISA